MYTDQYIKQTCRITINLKNFMSPAEKDFERYKIVIMYSLITNSHSYCKFAYGKEYVKIDVFTEL